MRRFWGLFRSRADSSTLLTVFLQKYHHKGAFYTVRSTLPPLYHMPSLIESY